jgi:hypothetical protein
LKVPASRDEFALPKISYTGYLIPVPNVISPNKRSITYLENRSVLEWFESIAVTRQTGVSEILREATSAYFAAHQNLATNPTLSVQRSAKKAAQRRETARLIATGALSADAAQNRNAPVNQPVRIMNFWAAIRAHTRAKAP